MSRQYAKTRRRRKITRTEAATMGGNAIVEQINNGERPADYYAKLAAKRKHFGGGRPRKEKSKQR